MFDRPLGRLPRHCHQLRFGLVACPGVSSILTRFCITQFGVPSCLLATAVVLVSCLLVAVAPQNASSVELGISKLMATPRVASLPLAATDLLDQALQADSQLPAPATANTVTATLVRLRPRRAATDRSPNSLTRARELLRVLHDDVLIGDFAPGVGRLNRTLRHGHYNCLTATLLYLAACRDAGLSAVALSAPHHVCVLLRLPEGVYVIELTQPSWHSRRYSPSQTTLREINDRQLLGRIYYNLGIEYAAAYRTELALNAAQIASELDPHDVLARDNLLAILNNRCLSLLQEGALPEAWMTVRAGLSIDPHHQPLLRCEIFLKQFDTYRHPE